jgi:hypothetical protein
MSSVLFKWPRELSCMSWVSTYSVGSKTSRWEENLVSPRPDGQTVVQPYRQTINYLQRSKKHLMCWKFKINMAWWSDRDTGGQTTRTGRQPGPLCIAQRSDRHTCGQTVRTRGHLGPLYVARWSDHHAMRLDHWN